MHTEHHALCQVGALKIRDSDLSQANILKELTLYQDKLAHDTNMQLAKTMQASQAQPFHYLQFDGGNEENYPPPINNEKSVTNYKLFALL